MEKCKVCGRRSKNDSLAIRMFGEKAEGICEVCAGKIYAMNTTRVKETYDREKMWLEQVLNSESVDVDTKLILKEITKDRKSEIVEIEKNRERAASKIVAKTFWTSIIKFVSICEIILFAVLGGFVGYTLARYGDDTVYTIIGALLGGFIGAVLSALNMFLIEVAENIASCVNLLSKIASKE